MPIQRLGHLETVLLELDENADGRAFAIPLTKETAHSHANEYALIHRFVAFNRTPR